MSLKYAILSVAYRENITGYDLLKRFDGSVGFFWKATYPQIYRELDSLEKEKLIVGKTQKQESRPDKKIFSITPLGEEALRKWCLEEINFKPTNNELLLKIFSGDLVGNEAINRHINDYIKYTKSQLEKLQNIKKDLPADEEQILKGKYAFNYISLLIGMHSYEEDIKNFSGIKEKIGKINIK